MTCLHIRIQPHRIFATRQLIGNTSLSSDKRSTPLKPTLLKLFYAGPEKVVVIYQQGIGRPGSPGVAILIVRSSPSRPGIPIDLLGYTIGGQNYNSFRRDGDQ